MRLRIIVAARQTESRTAIVVLDIHSGSMRQQVANTPNIPRFYCCHQRSIAVPVLLVDLRAFTNKTLDHFHIIAIILCRKVQRCLSLCILQIRVCALCQQQTQCVGRAIRCSRHQWGSTPFFLRVDARAMLQQQSHSGQAILLNGKVQRRILT